MKYTFDMARKAESFTGFIITIEGVDYFLEYFLKNSRWYAYEPSNPREDISQGKDLEKVFNELVNRIEKSNHPDEIEVRGMKFVRENKDSDYHVHYEYETEDGLRITLMKSLSDFTWDASIGHDFFYPVAYSARGCHDDPGYKEPEEALAFAIEYLVSFHKENEKLLALLK